MQNVLSVPVVSWLKTISLIGDEFEILFFEVFFWRPFGYFVLYELLYINTTKGNLLSYHFVSNYCIESTVIHQADCAWCFPCLRNELRHSCWLGSRGLYDFEMSLSIPGTFTLVTLKYLYCLVFKAPENWILKIGPTYGVELRHKS